MRGFSSGSVDSFHLKLTSFHRSVARQCAPVLAVSPKPRNPCPRSPANGTVEFSIHSHELKRDQESSSPLPASQHPIQRDHTLSLPVPLYEKTSWSASNRRRQGWSNSQQSYRDRLNTRLPAQTILDSRHTRSACHTCPSALVNSTREIGEARDLPPTLSCAVSVSSSALESDSRGLFSISQRRGRTKRRGVMGRGRERKFGQARMRTSAISILVSKDSDGTVECAVRFVQLSIRQRFEQGNSR